MKVQTRSLTNFWHHFLNWSLLHCHISDSLWITFQEGRNMNIVWFSSNVDEWGKAQFAKPGQRSWMWPKTGQIPRLDDLSDIDIWISMSIIYSIPRWPRNIALQCTKDWHGMKLVGEPDYWLEPKWRLASFQRGASLHLPHFHRATNMTCADVPKLEQIICTRLNFKSHPWHRVKSHRCIHAFSTAYDLKVRYHLRYLSSKEWINRCDQCSSGVSARSTLRNHMSVALRSGWVEPGQRFRPNWRL